ncbi:MAG: SH3 domain-containing protein [Saprospiraceae bacterium]|nr:SH3 domain-containing protein [Saprospiraceae bacterium]
MKTHFFLCLLLFASSPLLFAQQSNLLYVWAGSGLNMRKTPAFDGEKLRTLPYGTPVEMLGFAEIVPQYNDLEGDYEAPAVHYLEVMKTVFDNTPYTLEGSWIKVKAAGSEGFVFSGYLSDMPPHTSHEQERTILSIKEGMAAFQAYMRKNKGVLKENEQQIIFGDGASVTFDQQNPYAAKWVLPQCNEHDGYLLANYFLQLEKKISMPEDASSLEFYHYDRPNGHLQFYFDEGANMELDLRFIAPDILLLTVTWGGC